MLAARTGLRRGELRQLCSGDLDLVAGTVTVRASIAKNRKKVTLPVAADALALLTSNLPATIDRKARVFRSVPVMNTFRRDCERARIEHTNNEGKITFHSLRHGLSTDLARNGVPVAQHTRLMRHEDPRLSLMVYAHIQLDDLREAVAGLVPTERKEDGHGRKTGGASQG